jgi:hypothetical protein
MANGKVEVRFGEWIAEGWRMFVEQWQTWVLMSLITFAVLLVPIIACYFVAFVVILAAAAAEGGRRGGGGGPEAMGAVLLFYFVIFAGAIIAALIQSYFTCGMYQAALKQLRGARLEVRDLFSAGNKFGRCLGASILIGICVMIGVILCIIPAFIVAGMLMFTIPLILDRNLRITDAMTTSWELGKQNMLMFTLYAFVVSLIAQAGAYACYIGLLATWPLQFTMTIIAYRDCFGVPGARSYASPSTQATPYGASPPSQPQPQQWNQSACRFCGAALPPSGDFCSACGSRIG